MKDLLRTWIPCAFAAALLLPASGIAAEEQPKSTTKEEKAEVKADGKAVEKEGKGASRWGPRGLTLDLGDGMKMEFVLIEPGTFIMGIKMRGDKHTEVKAGPGGGKYGMHQVSLTKPYYIGKYEVTQEQYEKLMGENPSKKKGPKHPVEMVTWGDSGTFCEKLSEKTGQSARLPTEAEWEYACRAGTTTDHCNGTGLDGLKEVALVVYAFRKKGVKIPESHQPVGMLKPNAWGLYDMHGNVWEMVQDFAGDYPGTVTDPTGPETGTRRVMRGGAFYREANRSYSSHRGYTGDGRSRVRGFRVALTVKEPSE